MRGRGWSLLFFFFVGAGAFLWMKRADLVRWEQGAEDPRRVRIVDVDRPNDPGATADVRPPPSGELVDVSLLGEPWPVYGSEAGEAGEAAGNDAEYRELVQEIAAESSVRDVLYDPALSRAAREIAYHTGIHQHPPPEAALGFLLHASGAPEYTAAQYFTHTTAEDVDVVRETVRRALATPAGPMSQGPLRIGIGEISTPDGTYTRHVSAVATRRAYEIDTAPRYVPTGGEWRLSGRLPAGYQAEEASVLYPDNRLETVPLERDGSRFELRVPAGPTPGTMYVSIDGTDRRGPGKLLQLSVEVGATPATLPRSTRVFAPEVENGFASLEDAEAYAVSLLQADRQRFGLPPLEPDPELAAIARAHSRDMRDHDFFGHLSPRTGLAGDRLEAAGYRATMHAENLAKNDTLGEAQAALMASLGHRKNILDPKPTHVGIGLAEAEEDGEHTWYVTQLFARKVVAIDPEHVRSDLVARIQRAREERDLTEVRESARMSRVADTYARSVAAGELDGVARRALVELRPMNLTMTATVHAIYNLDQFQLPKEALDPKVTGIGVGVHQSEDDPHGRTGIVLIFARGWRHD